MAEWPSPVGLLLFQALRDTRLWASAEPGERGDLFSRGSDERHSAIAAATGLPPALREPLTALADLLGNATRADPVAVEKACREVARRAAEESAGATAIAFAEAAAMAYPDSPEAALQLGEIALRFADHPRADSWLRHAAALARGTEGARTHVEAEIQLGRLRSLQDDPQGARHHLLKAVRLAKRFALPALRGRAAHELFRLASAAGNHDVAEHYARVAVRCLAPKDREFASARREIAEYRLARADAPQAQSLLRDTLRYPLPHAEHVATITLLARAALVNGDPPTADRAWAGAVTLIVEHGETDRTARQLLALADATLGLLEDRRIMEIVRRAAEIARRRGQPGEAADADALLGVSGARSGESFP